LGIQSEKEVIPFAKFKDDKWYMKEDKPFIDIKTYRKKQKMITIRDTQLEDEHYYVLVESDIKPYYLKKLLSESIFDNEIRTK
jgi:hypothetical protein